VATQTTYRRRFVPGTTGWTEDDLNDPTVERLWDRGGYELVEGVLTRMPAAYLEGSLPLRRLIRQVEQHLERNTLPGEFALEVDLVINTIRVPRVDAVLLTPQQIQQQAAIEAARPTRPRVRFGRLRVAPMLVIESLSLNHETHDRVTKRGWYSSFGVQNYWLLDPFRHTLECLRLHDGEYQTDVTGAESQQIAPSCFPGLELHLDRVWL